MSRFSNPNRNHWQSGLQLVLALVIAISGLALAPAKVQAAPACTFYHTIQPGETLYKIGLKYNLLWTTIADANNISNPNKIYAGQKLCIPETQPAPTPSTTQYVQALVNVNIRKGPGMEYKAIGTLYARQTALILGQSANGNWWQIACPFKTTNKCYVTAKPAYTQVLVPVVDGDGVEVIPTFSIQAVVHDETVTIKTANFPKNVTFTVRMGKYGTLGVNGWVSTKINSGKGGTQVFSLPIPAEMQGSKQIAIRLDSKPGYFAYNWFWNNTTK